MHNLLPRILRQLLVFVCLLALSFGVRAQNVRLRKSSLTLKEAIEEIEKQTNMSVDYDSEVIDLNKVVSGSENGPLDSVLDNLLKDSGYNYKITGNHVIIYKPTSGNAEAQQVKARGKVLDEKGDPIIGAYVVLKGTQTGAVTDSEGNFELNVPDYSILHITYIGYVDRDVQVQGNSFLQVNMTVDTESLNEVVVTALGIKRDEKALGYSVQKIGGDQLQVVKGTDVATSLTGKISGLSIYNSSEISEKPTLSLRGENPLIVIDGVAYGNMTLSDVSAEDIESIDVLKGATASALYGVRGRAGAIMITTKKAGEEGTITVNVSNNTMFTAGYLKMPKAQHSYSTGNYGKLEYNSGNVWGDYMDGHEVEQYDPISMELKTMPLLPKGKNNIKNFIQTGIESNSNINISQQGKLGGFRISLTQTHQDGQYPNSKLDKYMISGSGNIVYNKSKAEASFSYKKEKAPNMPYSVYGNGNIFYNILIWGGTEYDIRDFKNYWKVKDQVQNWPFSAWYDNPYYIMHEKIDKRDNNLFSTSLTLSYDFRDNLSLKFRSGYDNYNNIRERRRSIGDSGSKRGYYYYGESDGGSFNNDLILNGDFKFGDFGLDFIAGLSSYWYKDNAISANTRGGLSVPGFYSLNASVERVDASKSTTKKALYSAYGKIGFSWRSGVFIDVTGRNDWSSTLPSDERSYFYPSFSGSFIPTAFYNPIEDVLDFWKVRASWTVAKKDLGVYELNSVYEVSTDVWEGLSTATYPSELRDPNIKPETEESFEVGTNLRFFGNRLGFDYTYFTRLRYDRIISADISEASGASMINTNTDEQLRQRGMEFTLTGVPVELRDFKWESSFNLSFYHWYYAKLDPVHSSQDPRLAKGERVDKFFMTDWETDHEGNIVHQAGLPVKNKYETVMGYSDPKFFFGWTNSFTYKNFNLTFSLDGRVGGLMYSWTEQAMWNSGAHPDSDNQWRYDEVVNGLTNYVGKGVKVVSGSATYDPYGNVISDTREFAPNDVAVSYQNYTQVYNENPWDHRARQNIKKATFVKLREVAFNYTLPQSFTQKIHMKNARVGIIGQNLFIWTKEFKYSDPDRGLENLNSPTPRYIGFNINLTF
jgi:TonB-linked SusC/RagA family outer membrane protein